VWSISAIAEDCSGQADNRGPLLHSSACSGGNALMSSDCERTLLLALF